MQNSLTGRAHLLEKGEGAGVEPVRKYWAHHPLSQPTIAAQLLGEPAAGEPYTILIMCLTLKMMFAIIHL
jgi:hypothetical protein